MSRKRTVRRVYDLINPIAHAQYQASKCNKSKMQQSGECVFERIAA